MALSGSKDFELDVIDYIDEAYERVGLNPTTAFDIKSARRSLNLLLADWANRGLNQWTVEQVTTTLTASTGTYNLGTDTIDILNLVIKRSSTDYECERLSRSDYLRVPNKTQEGRPTQYFVDRQINPVLYLWPVPENSTDQIVYNRLVRMDDADNFIDTLEVPFRLYPCIASGLAYMLALKRRPDIAPMLKQVYEDDMARALSEDRDRTSLFVVPPSGYT